jgi:hypothetical protein
MSRQSSATEDKMQRRRSAMKLSWIEQTDEIDAVIAKEEMLSQLSTEQNVCSLSKHRNPTLFYRES